MKQTEEQMYATMLRGMEARQDLTRVEAKLLARRDRLTYDAIMQYRCKDPEKKYTGNDALLFVAALSENLQLKDDLIAEERDGQRAQQKLTGER